MTARHFYRNDGGTMEAVDAVLRWSYQGSEKANEGEAGTWEAVVDDPDMTLDFVGHRRWIVYEDESDDANELLLDGITQATRIAHSGGDVTNPTGRVWMIEIADLNTLFSYRLMTGSDSQRPDETDIERVLDIIASEEMGYVDDLTYVSADDPTDMDEANVRGQTTGQVFDQAAQESSKNYWLGSYGTIDDGATMFAFYDHDSSDAYSSPLALSNDPADLDMAAFDAGTATVLPIGKDTELRRDYARVYDGAYGAFQLGAKYISRAENPDPPNITVSGRDIAYPAPEVKSRARMKARLLRVLARHETPDQVIKTTLFGVHARQATMIRKGMRIATTATHLPGYESPHYLRVLSAQPKPVGARYDIAIELQGPGVAAPAACSAEGEPEPFGGSWSWDIPAPFSGIGHAPTLDADLTTFMQPATTGFAEVGGSGYPSPGTPIYWFIDVDRGASPSPAAISRMQIRVNFIGSPTIGPTLYASNDGSSWTQIIDRATWDSSETTTNVFSLVIPADWRSARYFRIRSDDLFTSGFWAGFDYDDCYLVECIP